MGGEGRKREEGGGVGDIGYRGVKEVGGVRGRVFPSRMGGREAERREDGEASGKGRGRKERGISHNGQEEERWRTEERQRGGMEGSNLWMERKD